MEIEAPVIRNIVEKADSRIDSVQVLRGIAALIVAIGMEVGFNFNKRFIYALYS